MPSLLVPWKASGWRRRTIFRNDDNHDAASFSVFGISVVRNLMSVMVFCMVLCWSFVCVSYNTTSIGCRDCMKSNPAMITTREASSTTITTQNLLYPPNPGHKTNAIVYMAQKSHKVYLRDSLALLERSLVHLFENYLFLNNQYQNVTVFIFHTGDFNETDVTRWTSDLLQFRQRNIHDDDSSLIQLVNLQSTQYWQTPSWLNEDHLQQQWRNPEFNIGYRHMIRWYAVRIWDYFATLNHETQSNYRYIMRMDEESVIQSPIRYDLFNFMAVHDYEYGFRTCSYEMNSIQQILHNYTLRARLEWGPEWVKQRQWNGAQCGFYNNWFVASLDFFRSDKVQHFLKFIDDEGFMYRDRLNDLVIQTAAVYSFAPESKIHRFLDFTYQHFTMRPPSPASSVASASCPLWGSLSTGYMDDAANETVAAFVRELQAANCPVALLYDVPPKRQVPELHVAWDDVADLSPTYSHLPPDYNRRNGHGRDGKKLLSVKAGKIDLRGRGLKSG